MGKATRWLKGILEVLKGSGRRTEEPRRSKEKRRWSFVKSSSLSCNNPNSAGSANQHAIVVAAASAAAAEAAVAAAQAAAAVVSLTAARRRRPDRAAVLIQSQFRGYLARRALKALKALVKLQALVRGYIMRKRTAETMRSIQAMLRAQARARTVRSYDSPTSSGKSSQINHPEPATPEKSELTSHYRRTAHHRRVPVDHPFKGYISNAWSGPQLGESRARHIPQYQRERDKILEIDTGGRQYGNRGLDFYSGQLTSKEEDDDDEFSSRSIRRQVGPHTPTKSDASVATSCFSDCPSYMAFTESSKAKMRSMSAPRHRPLLQQQQQHYDSMKRWSVHHQTHSYAASAMHASFASKAYPGSGHLDTLGMPIRNNRTSLVYYSGYLN